MSTTTLPVSGSPDAEASDKRKLALWLIAGLAVLALLAWGVSHIKLSGSGSKPKQQTVKITLPDTPPPPPPKPEEKRPEPKQDNKPQQQQEQKQAPVAPPQTKIDDAPSSNGSSNLPPSGKVENESSRGIVNLGPGGGVPSAEDRRKSQFYVNNIRRALKEELERHLDTEERQLVVTFSVWISADGHLSKYELVPTGNPRADADARQAFEATVKTLRLEKPGDVIQPLRLKLTLLQQG